MHPQMTSAIQEDGEEQLHPRMTSETLITACCGCLFMLIFVEGAIASFVFTIIFLVKDEGKGGSCADTAGQAIWTYVIVKTIVGPISSQCFGSPDEDGAESGGDTRLVSFFCMVAITLGMLIYGGLVLYSPEVCSQYKNTGLYQMYSILYIVDAVAMIILIIAYAGLSFFYMGKSTEPRNSIATDDIKVGEAGKDITNPVALAEPLNP